MRDFIENYKEILGKLTDAPEIYLETAGYMLLSATLGRWTYAQIRPQKPNLFVILIGPANIVRKTTILEFVEAHIKQIDKDLPVIRTTPDNILYHNASVWLKDWFNFFLKYERRYKLYSEIINSILYEYMNGIYVSILGTIDSPFAMFVDKKDFTSGFLNHFLLVYASKKEKLYPVKRRELESQNEIDKLISGLKQKYDLMKGNIIKINFSNDTIVKFDNFDQEIKDEIINNQSLLYTNYLSEVKNKLKKLVLLHRLGREIDFKDFLIEAEEIDYEYAYTYLRKVLDNVKEVIKKI